MQEDANEIETEETYKSRSQLKREDHARKKMGEKLVQLSDDQLRRMQMNEELLEAIREARGMHAHGARRRQMQYIGTLMRAVDMTPVEQALLEIEQGSYQQTQAFHQLESWRDKLIENADGAMDEVLEALPHADRQRLGQLVRSARKEKNANKPPKSARNLFRYLKELSDG